LTIYIQTKHDEKIHSGIIAFPVGGHHPTYALIENGFKKCQRPPIYKSHNFQLDDYITDLLVAMQELLYHQDPNTHFNAFLNKMN